MSVRTTYFHGGPLHGQTLQTLGAHYYLHEMPGKKYAEYKRLRAVYADGDTRATDANRSRLSHLEYEYIRELDKP